MNFIVLDCETCPLDVELTVVAPSNMFYYDLGWVVVNENGEVLKSASYVNADIFLDEKELMKSAYYSDKIPQYWEDIKNGKRLLKSSYNIRKRLLEDIKDYHVKHVFAHNMRFDFGALNNTFAWLTKSKYHRFLPYSVEACDTLKLARMVFGKDEDYKTFCLENDFMTKNNRVRLTAEIIYKYLTKEFEFEESHTGLEDCLIEKEILMHCLKYCSPSDGRLY